MSLRLNHQTNYSAESARLWLEPLTAEEHLDDFHELWTDPDAVKWTIRVAKRSIEETAEWLTTILPSKDQPDIDKWAILLRNDIWPCPSGGESPQLQPDARQNNNCEKDMNPSGKPKCIGIVGNNRRSEQGMETGYCINKNYWGKGYATEAFSSFLSMFWAIPERQDIPHLVAKVYPDNMQSFKVLKKCGGREGEILRSVELRGGAGERGDLHCWYFDRPTRNASVDN